VKGIEKCSTSDPQSSNQIKIYSLTKQDIKTGGPALTDAPPPKKKTTTTKNNYNRVNVTCQRSSGDSA